MRLIKIEGELNGHKFQVKPESLKASKIDAELRDEMAKWQEKNNPKFVAFMEKYRDKIAANDFSSLPDMPDNKDWKEDVEFRLARFKKMASHCLDFEDSPPASLWKSDDLEYGVILEAWDFFTGTRKTPMNISAR